MEYGEIAVNYNAADPVLFIKDSADGIIRVSNLGPEANDGNINIEAGDGIEATGDNASANQLVDTTRTIALKVDAGYGLEVDANGVKLAGAWTNIPILPSI